MKSTDLKKAADLIAAHAKLLEKRGECEACLDADQHVTVSLKGVSEVYQNVYSHTDIKTGTPAFAVLRDFMLDWYTNQILGLETQLTALGVELVDAISPPEQ